MTQLTTMLWTASLVFCQIDAGTTSERLQDLNYFVGTWRVTGSIGNEKFEGNISWKWINNKNFLMQTLSIPSRKAEYLEIVGWDPEQKSLTSWGFGTFGGHGRFAWHKQDDGWTADVIGRWLAWDGTRLAQRRSLRRVAENHYVFEETVTPEDKSSSAVMHLDARRITP